jgi:steroid 5-alpha reductase family enzyme
MVSFLVVYWVIGLAIAGFMTALWVLSLLKRDSSIADVFWGMGFAIATWISFALTPEGFPERKLLICTLVTIWGLRLSLHILLRNRGKDEDYRYREWREQAGARWWWFSYIKVFLLQGFLIWLISTPLLAAQMSSQPNKLIPLDYTAAGIWLIGFCFEVVADWQLARFKADPENDGKVLSTGVWRYSRHPNYFGDATQWWAFYLIAAAAGSFWTVLSPIVMTILLLRVSGVRLSERHLVATKPQYREYVAKTSAFIPWIPKDR